MFPEEVILQNYRSYMWGKINLGKPDQVVIINGLNGSGKTSISEAIQIAFGQRFQNFDDIIRTGKDQAIIEVKMNNQSQTSEEFPEFFWVKCKLVRGKGATRYIKYGELDNYKEERSHVLKNIVDVDDSLTFLDQGTARHWVITSPRKRWEALEEIIGISEIKKKMFDIKNEKENVDEMYKQLVHAIADKQSSVNIFRKLKENYEKKQTYQLKQEKYSKFQKLIHSIQSANEIQILNKERFQLEEDLESNILELKGIKDQIKYQEILLENLENKNQTNMNKLESLKSKSVGLSYKIDEYEKDLYYIEERRSEVSLGIKNIPPFSDLEKKAIEIQNQIIQIGVNEKQNNDENIRLLNEIENYEKGKASPPKNIQNFRTSLNKNSIPFEFFYEILDIVPKFQDYSQAFESVLGGNKYNVIVAQKYYYKALNLAKQNNFRHYIIYPEFLIGDKINKPSIFEGAIHSSKIYSVHSEKFSNDLSQKVIARFLHNTYFVKNIKDVKRIIDKNLYLAQYRYVSLDCVSQDRFGGRYIRDREFLIGEKNRKYQYDQNKEKLSQLKKQLLNLNNKGNQLKTEKEKNDDLIVSWKEYNKYFSQEKEEQMKSLHQKVSDIKNQNTHLEKKIEDLKKILENPLQKKKMIQDQLENLNGREARKSGEVEEFKEDRDKLNQKVIKLGEDSDLLPFSHDIMDYPRDYIEYIHKLCLQFIEEEFQDIDKHIIDLKNFSEKLITPEYWLNISKNDIYVEINSFGKLLQQEHIQNALFESVETYQIQNKELEDMMEKREIYNEQLIDWNQKFEETRTQLEAHQNKWQEDVSKSFSEIMGDLGMQGNIKITPLRDLYELHIYATTHVDRQLIEVKKNSFSGGQLTMIAMAFTLAINKISPREFMILDEYDQELDVEKQYVLTSMFKKYMPEKLIMISPKSYSKNYLSLFDWIIHMRINTQKGSFGIAFEMNPKKIRKNNLLEVVNN